MKNIIVLHVLVILGIFFPLGNIIFPYIYWKCSSEKDLSFSRQACNILNFQLLVSFLCCIGMLYVWYQFVHLFGEQQKPNYELMVYPIGGYFLLCGVYPLAIAIYLSICKKLKLFYPSVLRLFK